MTFEEWWAASGPEGTRREGAASLAQAAWEAATAEAARRAVETSRRYTCKNMIGACNAIAYEIQRTDR